MNIHFTNDTTTTLANTTAMLESVI